MIRATSYLLLAIAILLFSGCDSEKYYYNLYKKELVKHEGYRNNVYRDRLGNLTVGIGHLIINDISVKEGDYYSDFEVERLFQQDLKVALQIAREYVLEFDQKPEPIQIVLVGLAFNLGETRFGKFKKFIEAVNNRDYVTASKEIRNSKYYRQVPTRAEYYIQLLLNP